MDDDAKDRAMKAQIRATEALVKKLCRCRHEGNYRNMTLCLQIEFQRLKLHDEAKGNPMFAEVYKMVKSQKSYVEAQQKLDEDFPSVSNYE